MKFTKMQGCGNDYVYINGFSEQIHDPSELAKAVSNRNFGVGSDGLILILPSEIADFRMRMFNFDGSESEMCGNGIRCVGKYVHDKGLTTKKEVSVETLAGIKKLVLHEENGVIASITVDMGEPIFAPEKIPVKFDKDPVLGLKLCADSREFSFNCVSMGNPHAITYVDDVSTIDVEHYGKILEVDSNFPKRANIEFIQIESRKSLHMRVWERGSGETLACGTGACGSAVVTAVAGLCDREVVVHLRGGDLFISWSKEDNHVYMTGPAKFVFDGEFDDGWMDR